MTITLDLFPTASFGAFRSEQETFMLSLLGLSDQGVWIISNGGKRAEFVLPGASQASIAFTGRNFTSNGPELTGGTIKTAELIDFACKLYELERRQADQGLVEEQAGNHLILGQLGV